jgi:hypothetical protein
VLETAQDYHYTMYKGSFCVCKVVIQPLVPGFWFQLLKLGFQFVSSLFGSNLFGFGL